MPEMTKDELERIKSELRTFRTPEFVIRKHCERLIAALESAWEKLNAAGTVHADFVQGHAEKLNAVTAERDQLQQRIPALEGANEQWRVKALGLQSEVQRLQADNGGKSYEIKKLCGDVERLRAENSQLRANEGGFETAFTQLNQAVDHLQTENAVSAKQITDLQFTVDQLQGLLSAVVPMDVLKTAYKGGRVSFDCSINADRAGRILRSLGFDPATKAYNWQEDVAESPAKPNIGDFQLSQFPPVMINCTAYDAKSGKITPLSEAPDYLEPPASEEKP
jgi:hypothetical protein